MYILAEIRLFKSSIKHMGRIKIIIILFMLMFPFFSYSLEPIFGLKGKSIMLSSSPSTLGVVYNPEALSKKDFSKKNLSPIDFAGKVITVTNVNVIDWDKKSQGIIMQFIFDANEYCFYFPQNIHTSDITKKRPFSRFYTGTYMDMYQNHDDSHFIDPENIDIEYWLCDDIAFLQSKIGSKFGWSKDHINYVFDGFDPLNNKYQFRKYVEGEIKPSNAETRDIFPRSTTEKGYSVYSRRYNDIIYQLIWEEE